MGETLTTFLGFVLAQGNGGGGQAAGDPFGGLTFFIPLIAILVIWYFLMIRPQNAERARRREMLEALKKNDRVVTTAGMLGTVANISQDGKEVTLKFGDSTRIPFLRSAIESIVVPEGSEGESSEKK